MISSTADASISSTDFSSSIVPFSTITLPSSPSQGDTVSFIDSEGTFDTNNLTVEPGSEKIMANTAGDEMVVDTNNAGFALVYQDSTYGWRLRSH